MPAFDPVKTSAGSGKDEIPFSTAQPVALDRTLRSAATLQGLISRAYSKKEARRRTEAKLVASDRFVEQEIIARGGMSLVIRAHDTSLDRDVAIKLIPAEAWPSDADVERLAREARTTARLDHPAIIPVYEFGIDRRGVAFFSMKLVDGETLEDMLRWVGPARLDTDFLFELLDIFDKVCDAVAFAHSRGVLHLDLKPANVIVADFGRVYVADWGVARPTGSRDAGGAGEPVSDRRGLIVGTPHYMAPEQLTGEDDALDQRTDVFLLGAMLHQILTGHPPRDASRMSIARPTLDVASETTPRELARIAMRAMADDPADRYPTVSAMMRELRAFQERRISFAGRASDAVDGDPRDADPKLFGTRPAFHDVGRVEDAGGAELFADAEDVDVQALGAGSKVA